MLWHNSNNRGGATVLKVGGQNVIRERSERKKIFFVPPTFAKSRGYNFLHVGYEQGNKYHY